MALPAVHHPLAAYLAQVRAVRGGAGEEWEEVEEDMSDSIDKAGCMQPFLNELNDMDEAELAIVHIAVCMHLRLQEEKFGYFLKSQKSVDRRIDRSMPSSRDRDRVIASA